MLHRVRVDLTDLRSIETELSVIGPLEIKSDQVEGTAESIEEFTRLDVEQLDSITMTATKKDTWRYLRVNIDRETAFLTGSDDALIAGVRGSVEQLLRRRRLRFVQFLATAGTPLFAFLGFTGAGAGIAAIASDGGSGAVGVLLVGGGFLIAAGVAFILGRVQTGQVLLVSRAAQPGWFKRNRDGLIVQTVGGLIVLVVGFVAGRLTH
jgi:hypothetical protein